MTNLRIVLFIVLFWTVILSVYYFVIDDNIYYIIAQEPTLNDPNLQVETIVEGLSCLPVWHLLIITIFWF